MTEYYIDCPECGHRNTGKCIQYVIGGRAYSESVTLCQNCNAKIRRIMWYWLLGCPFCKRQAKTYRTTAGWGVECTECGATTRATSETEQDAIKFWNGDRVR